MALDLNSLELNRKKHRYFFGIDESFIIWMMIEDESLAMVRG